MRCNRPLQGRCDVLVCSPADVCKQRCRAVSWLLCWYAALAINVSSGGFVEQTYQEVEVTKRCLFVHLKLCTGAEVPHSSVLWACY